jgi:hypothetical protein
MILTREIINILTPVHGRTSCSDTKQINGCGGWTGKYNEDTGKKVINYPDCNRCYLLNHEGEDTDNLEFGIQVTLWEQKW